MSVNLAKKGQSWHHLVRPAGTGRWYAPLAVDEQSEAWLMGWPGLPVRRDPDPTLGLPPAGPAKAGRSTRRRRGHRAAA